MHYFGVWWCDSGETLAWDPISGELDGTVDDVGIFGSLDQEFAVVAVELDIELSNCLFIIMFIVFILWKEAASFPTIQVFQVTVEREISPDSVFMCGAAMIIATHCLFPLYRITDVLSIVVLYLLVNHIWQLKFPSKTKAD